MKESLKPIGIARVQWLILTIQMLLFTVQGPLITIRRVKALFVK